MAATVKQSCPLDKRVSVSPSLVAATQRELINWNGATWLIIHRTTAGEVYVTTDADANHDAAVPTETATLTSFPASMYIEGYNKVTVAVDTTGATLVIEMRSFDKGDCKGGRRK